MSTVKDFDQAWQATLEFRRALDYFTGDKIPVNMVKDFLDKVLGSFPEGFSPDNSTETHGDMVRTVTWWYELGRR